MKEVLGTKLIPEPEPIGVSTWQLSKLELGDISGSWEASAEYDETVAQKVDTAAAVGVAHADTEVEPASEVCPLGQALQELAPLEE